MDFAAVRDIADAVLYEGYLLYPYTASAHKNRLRWQFGVIVPRAHEAAGTGEHGHQQTEVLFAGGSVAGDDSPGARIAVAFRFLQVEARYVEAFDGDTYAPVTSLVVDGKRHLTFDESIEREIVCELHPATQISAAATIAFDGVRRIEELRSADGTLAGRVVRERWPLAGELTAEVAPCSDAAGESLRRLRVRVENHSAVVAAGERGVVLRTAFVSGHTLLGIEGGLFFSPIDPPEHALAATARLSNEHTWPVLAGEAGSGPQRATLVLSSPIVLPDFPQIAKKTEADAFDGTEIDELLTLSVLSLSDDERAEARATDPRARAIVDRAEAFGAPDVARLHAEFEPVPVFDSTEAFAAFSEPAATEPQAAELDVAALEVAAPERITIGGVVVGKGSSVRLAPKRRADAWDMFLAGKTATVQKIHQDFENRIYVAVTVDDDPASEYHEWYGRSFFFETDEVEALGVTT
jgi:hypothetical protein